MIGKVTRGCHVAGLLRYLYGPGRRNEHTDPHLVAGWDDPTALEPAPRPTGRADTTPLARLLDQPLRTVTRKPTARPVWQCSIRTAPEDRVLSDAEWGEVARDVVARAGFAPDGDPEGCRWVAVRHADDHIHIVVTLARQDGRPVQPRNDFYRVGEACRAAEESLGLRRTAPRDRTAARPATYGEREKAQRQHRPEPARATLRRQVRIAAAGAHGLEEFLDRLRDSGLLLRTRLSEHTPGEITGYAVALADVKTAAGMPVWYGGGKLAADLSLPKLRRRWTGTPPCQNNRRPLLDAAQRADAWAQAQQVTAHATTEIRRLAAVHPHAAADVAWAASDALSAMARVVEGARIGPLTRASDAYERAARDLFGRTPARHPLGTAMRAAARALALTGRARRDEAVQLQALILNLIALTQAVAELRRAQGHAAQAAAARSAALHLHTAAATTSTGLTRPPSLPHDPERHRARVSH